MANEKITERVRKLLELSKSGNEHEAAAAAARASELMSEHAITEAMLEVTSADDAYAAHVTERIIEGDLPESPERRVAWRDRVASSVARSLDCEVFYTNSNINAIGRESAIGTWRYTCAYLFSEITRLADEAWLAEGRDLAAVGQTPRAWKSAFRLGAADVVANKLYLELKDRKAREGAQALKIAEGERQRALAAATDSSGGSTAIVLAEVVADKAIAKLEAHRAEVKSAYEKRTSGPGWRKTRAVGNSTRGRSGYEAGREAGGHIALNKARGALKG